MLFLFIDQHNYNQPPISLRGATCESMLLHRHLLGLRRLFCFFHGGFQKVIRRGIPKTDKDIDVVTKWVKVPFYYILFVGRKYLSGIAGSHLLIRRQSLYCQSSSPCKSFHLNGEYKYRRFLLPCCTYHGYSRMYVSGNQTERR